MDSEKTKNRIEQLEAFAISMLNQVQIFKKESGLFDTPAAPKFSKEFLQKKAAVLAKRALQNSKKKAAA